MSAGKIAGIVLIGAGVFALVYHGFSYTRESHEAKIGALELSIRNKETVDIPTWAGVGAILVGAVLLLVGNRKI
jgi:drug/metabolite transporter (DMT)-like permease